MGSALRTKPSHLRAALREYAVHRPDQAHTLLAMAEQLQRSPTDSSRKVAESLLAISDVPDETWHGPLPTDTGERMLSVAIDRLSAEWTLTKLHRLVAVRRVAWAAQQLARVIEKSLDADLKQT
jgi:hypothetical protein